MKKWFERCSWNLKICARLLQRDMYVFKEAAVSRLINTAVWVWMIIYIYEYVGLGFSGVLELGLFIACSECIARGFMGLFGNLVRLLCDLKGSNTLSYHLSLPAPHWMVLVTVAISQAIQLMILAAVVFPIAGVILHKRLLEVPFSCFKIGIIFLLAYLFYGFLTLLYAGLIDSTDKIGTLRVRFNDVFFWLGAYFFTWQRLYTANHIFAYVDLLNPLVYACEGMRAAVMGQAGYLSFWICCLALAGFSVVIGYWGVQRMMRKLDCVR